MHRIAVLEREDLAVFINAACACTGQSEFYGDSAAQRVSLAFLHDYVFGNYRRLYALCLAAGINHFNQAAIVARLLSAGAPANPERRQEEGLLIAGALRELPPQRVYRLFDRLRRSKVNNRRTRATFRRWLTHRDPVFDGLKYRGHLRSAARHTHQSLDDEVHGFLFEGPHSRKHWDAALFDSFRRARYDESAIYELPFTVAEGLAAAKGVPRKRFLKGIEPRLTAAERVRILGTAERNKATVDVDLSRVPLTKLSTLILSKPVSERPDAWDEALTASATRAAGQLRLGRVRAVLDRSFSTTGGAQKRRRPLAVALGISRLLRVASADYRALWTHPTKRELHVTARGQTDLATPLLDALQDAPDLVVVVSDGFENDPPGAVGEVLRLYREHLDPHGRTAVLHLNPVFDATAFMPRPLGHHAPTLGIRDAEELPKKLAFARFVHGAAPIDELEAWLLQRARRWLEAT